jgi:hypothetical protein
MQEGFTAQKKTSRAMMPRRYNILGLINMFMIIY